jgi:glycosyltransferase involved in cell wall biosynthesis
MTRAIRDIVLDAELRGRMERLGHHRASLFTWERTARKTLDIYYGIADRKRPSMQREGTSISIVRP